MRTVYKPFVKIKPSQRPTQITRRKRTVPFPIVHQVSSTIFFSGVNCIESFTTLLTLKVMFYMVRNKSSSSYSKNYVLFSIVSYFATLSQSIYNNFCFLYRKISHLIVSLTTSLTSLIFQQYRIGFREEFRKTKSDAANQARLCSVAFLCSTASTPHGK